MTLKLPMPAETCQNDEILIGNDLHKPLNISKDTQIVENQRLSCKSAGLRLRWFESSPAHHVHDSERCASNEALRQLEKLTAAIPRPLFRSPPPAKVLDEGRTTGRASPQHGVVGALSLPPNPSADPDSE
jgi:hypothetical protein